MLNQAAHFMSGGDLVSTDPLFSQTVLLIQPLAGETQVGDKSKNKHLLTCTGTVGIDPYTAWTGGASVSIQPASGNHLLIPTTINVAGDFCIEMAWKSDATTPDYTAKFICFDAAVMSVDGRYNGSVISRAESGSYYGEAYDASWGVSGAINTLVLDRKDGVLQVYVNNARKLYVSGYTQNLRWRTDPGSGATPPAPSIGSRAWDDAAQLWGKLLQFRLTNASRGYTGGAITYPMGLMPVPVEA
ncbi:hypothetical protein GBZ48_35570 [Azospirillum melinis]|uniref:Uncharacterized protein n=1 Tax=Azospirillum melinis TaxID=328839 RepID=A0ABX2KTI2_9PROT|nr:hypothetical protein [Azospirillum melinis]MBP2310701.1 hypothetical protein [Azospirillum melinis]NUB04514.1 hypothetical protein [Azospirillum melinis]